MAWRTLLIQRESRLRAKNRQLICDDGHHPGSVAMEELAVVILDTPAVLLSSAVLASLCDAGAAVVVCDAKHTPSGMLLPFHQHSRQAAVAAQQIGWKRPFCKRVWQAVVRRKILNQAKCLQRLRIEGADRLRHFVRHVDSGDTGNVEGRAAQFYWKCLFGTEFRRAGHRSSDPGRVNAALNYGYAVARAAVARSITAHGLLPCLGVHHDNQLNAFNLADDLLEPLRPVVDHFVYRLANLWEDPGQVELDRDDRVALAAVGALQLLIGGERRALIPGSDLMAQSLVRAGKEKAPGLLMLPEFASEEENTALG